jgi:hypothetical protein
VNVPATYVIEPRCRIESTRPFVCQVDFGVEAIVPAHAGGTAASIPATTLAKTIALRMPDLLRQPVENR